MIYLLLAVGLLIARAFVYGFNLKRRGK